MIEKIARGLFIIFLMLMSVVDIAAEDLMQGGNPRINVDYLPYTIAWHPDGTRLAVGSSEGVKIYDQNLNLIHEFQPFVDEVKAVAWSPDGTQFTAGGWYEDGRILVWNYQSATDIFTLSH